MHPYGPTPEQTEVISLVRVAHDMHYMEIGCPPRQAYLSRAAFERFPSPNSPIAEIQILGLPCRVMDRLPGISAVIFAARDDSWCPDCGAGNDTLGHAHLPCCKYK